MSELAVTAILTSILMFVLEIEGPQQVLRIVNRYFTDISQNRTLFEKLKHVKFSERVEFTQSMNSELADVFEHLEKLPNLQKIDQHHPNRDENLRVFVMYMNGRPVAPNILRVVELSERIKMFANRDLHGMWNSYITFYAPGKHVDVSNAPCKGLLRLQAPLPLKCCSSQHDELDDHRSSPNEMYMILGNFKHVFASERNKVGDVNEILFDPTFPVSYVNHTHHWTAILTVDVLRPFEETSKFAEGLNRLVLGMIAKHADVENALRRAVVRFPHHEEHQSNIREVIAEPKQFGDP